MRLPNPTEELVQKGFAAYQSAECDHYIIASGGGSPIDKCKSGENPHRQPSPFHRLPGVGKVKTPAYSAGSAIILRAGVRGR